MEVKRNNFKNLVVFSFTAWLKSIFDPGEKLREGQNDNTFAEVVAIWELKDIVVKGINAPDWGPGEGWSLIFAI